MSTIDKGPTNEALQGILENLKAHMGDLSYTVQVLENAVKQGNFKYLSKANRNELFADLLSFSDATSDVAKIAFRNLKKVKRVRPPEEVVDAVFGAVPIAKARAVSFATEADSPQASSDKLA